MRAGDQVGLYRLEELIAEGGMGAVWRAHHPTLDRRVALKFVRNDARGNDHARDAFMREVRHLSRLHGPQIVQIQDFGFTDGGHPYMVTEFLEGEDLLSRLKKVSTLDVAETLSIGVEVLKALGEAHAMGLVHRDLKPGNIFLQSLAGGARTAVKVLDFGVAKLLSADELESTLWPAGTPKGSPRYMSPEQILDEPVTPASDFYAFSATLYRTLCGEPVFGGSLAVMMQAHLESTPQPLRDRFPRLGIPDRLDELLIECLAKNPADRPSDAGALQAEFEHLLASHTHRPSRGAASVETRTQASPASLASVGTGAGTAELEPPASRALLGPPRPSDALGTVNANVDPLEHTGDPLSVSAPSSARLMANASTPAAPGEATASEATASEATASEATASEARASTAGSLTETPSGSLPGSTRPSSVQSARRPQGRRPPWELLVSGLVLGVGAFLYLSAGNAGDGEREGLAPASTAVDASARMRTLRALDAATRIETPSPVDAAPAARPSVVRKDAEAARTKTGPTVLVRVVPGKADFRRVEGRQLICKQVSECRLPINVDIRVEKPGYLSKVLSGDDLYDRRNGSWRIVLKRR